MAWSTITNIKGPQGDQGPQGVQGNQGIQGETGAVGTRGSLWYSGSGAPGTIPGALAGDLYLDTNTGDVYTFA